MTRHTMETLAEALARLEKRGFRSAFQATPDGSLVIDSGPPVAPEGLIVEETVRFEGASNPGDEAVLFALRSRDGKTRGTFVTAYGPQTDPGSAEALHRLPREPRPGHRS